MQPPPADQIAPGAVLGNVETMLEGIVAELDDPAVGGYLDAMQGPMQTLFNSLLPGELRRKLTAEADAAAPEDPPVLRLHLQDNRPVPVGADTGTDFASAPSARCRWWWQPVITGRHAPSAHSPSFGRRAQAAQETRGGRSATSHRKRDVMLGRTRTTSRH
jgi:hypothetical protein